MQRKYLWYNKISKLVYTLWWQAFKDIINVKKKTRRNYRKLFNKLTGLVGLCNFFPLQYLPKLFCFFFGVHLLYFFLILFFYCSGFCHTLKWISHGFTCVPHPDPPSHLPLHPIPLGLPSAPGQTFLMM